MPPHKKLHRQSQTPSTENDDDIAASSTSASSSVINPQDLRDIDILMRPFSGNENVSITQWFKDFENYVDLFKWNDLQKMIYARRLLRGPAKAFIDYEVKPLDYATLKARLTREFQEKVTSATVHKQLQTRKKKRDESLQEYLYEMMNIGSQARVEDAAIMDYVIAGINDSEINKVVLYGAEDMRDFKNKLKVYENFKRNSGNQSFHTNSDQHSKSYSLNKEEQSGNPKFSNKDSKRNNRHCFNCGSTTHEFYNCPDRSKGPKCFRCHQFGHKGQQCEQWSKKTEPTKTTSLAEDRKTYCSVKIGDVDLEALIDTGSDITLMKETDFNKINPKCNLVSSGFTVAGLGSEVRTRGFFVSDLLIDNVSFPNISIYVVADNVMRPSMLVGMNLLSKAKVVITKGGVKIEKVDCENSENTQSEEESCINRLYTSGSAVDSFLIDAQDFPDLGHIQSKDVAINLNEIVKTYRPEKTKESPVKMKITLLDDIPVYQPPRRLALKERIFVEQQLSEWIRDGIVRESFSNYASPIVLVKKKDDTLRLCVDYRNLNKKIYRDRFPIPIIEEQIDFLLDAKFFSTLDLANGFFHVAIEEESIKYTAFVTPHGHFEFLRMPFGLCNSPPTFQRFIVAIFRPLIQARKVMIYIDDLIIPSKSEEGFLILQEVLGVAKNYGLEIKWKKCKILQTEVEYLGYLVSNGKVKPSPSKTKAVLGFQEPRTLHQVQSFLGLAGYFRKFIKDFAIKARPLTELLKNGVKFDFNEECRKSFILLKEALASSPVLSIFRPGATTELHTDACMYGYGACLLQINPDDNSLHPIGYMSRKTTSAEQKYNSYELEVLAVIAAIKKFRPYLLGQPFKLVTDCKAFEMTLKKKDLATRVARWTLLLEEFEFVVEHRSGNRIKHVDSLSRNPVSMIISVNDTVWKQLEKAQREDENLQPIFEILATKNYKDYIIHNGLLCKCVDGNMLYVVPRQMEEIIVRKVHEQGHFNFRKMEDIVKKEFYISQLKDKVDKCVRNCVQCILANRKEGRAEGYLHPIPKGECPLDTFHVDHLGPMATTSKGYKYVLSVIDGFTKFIWIFPVKSLATDEAIKKLEVVAATFGNPRRIIADRHGAFIANTFKKYCEEEKIELFHITTGVPRGNGQIERAHRVVISVLTKLSIHDPPSWYKQVGKVQQFLNSTYQRAICTSPFRLLTGTSMQLKENLNIKEIVEQEIREIYQESRDDLREKAKEALLKIQEENRKTFNKKRKPPHSYQIGDLVAIERTQFGTGLKIRSHFLGPYEIIRILPHERFEVKKVGEHEGPSRTTTSVDKIKLWTEHYQSESSSSETDEVEDGRV